MTTDYDRDKNHGLAISPYVREHTKHHDHDVDHSLAMTTDYSHDNDHSLAVKVLAALDLLFASSNSDNDHDGDHDPAVTQDHGRDNDHGLPVISSVKSSNLNKQDYYRDDGHGQPVILQKLQIISKMMDLRRS